MSINWHRWSLVSQVILLTYYQIIEWVSLFPWNDIRRGNGQAKIDFIVGGIMLLLILVTVLRARWAMAVGAALYGWWFWLQIQSWWLPYIQGASPGWKRVYGRYFAETVNFLPTAGDHLAPDACHIVLQLLIVSALVTTALAVLHHRSQSISAGNEVYPMKSRPASQHD